MYREEYAKAGFKMLPVIDPQGHRTGRQQSATRSACCGEPVAFSFPARGPVYLVGALVLGLVFLWYAIQFSRHLTGARARQLFFVFDPLSPPVVGTHGFGQDKVSGRTKVGLGKDQH